MGCWNHPTPARPREIHELCVSEQFLHTNEQVSRNVAAEDNRHLNKTHLFIHAAARLASRL